ncbi:galactose-3-O-sulfotransferase 2-like [Clavelina lepadiformis]|uniref:galactose-3-O-sulfotransferase 2-like n=1 Tax=Clavelina lepadiformis TaxID=159417 RepID=UPI004041764F
MRNILKRTCTNVRRSRTIQVLMILIFGLCAISFYYTQSLSTTKERADFYFHLPIMSNISQKEISSALTDQPRDGKEADECSTVKPFVYIKTHKTGSSTVKQICRLYKRANHLQREHCYVNPVIGGYPGRIQQRFLFRLKDDVGTNKKNECIKTAIYHHSRLNLTLVKNIMPKRTRVFTIIRQPWKQFQSAFNYYYAKNFFEEEWREKKQLEANCFLYPYLHIAEGRNIDVLEYFDLAFENLDQNIPYFFKSKNPQAFDLGLDSNLEDEEEIKKNIEILDSGIDLVMINEHMEESLILLKNIMNVTWKTLVGKHRNVRSYPHYNLDEYPERNAKFQKMFKLDIFLYRHFNATLWRKVDEYGRERMDNDITKLRKLKGVKKAKILQTESNRMKKSNFDFKDLFDSIPKTYNDTFLVNILYEKLSKIKNRNKTLSYDLAKYMVDNHGGCPL